MGISVETLAVAKKYTNRSIEGISGSLAGKNATVESITDITGGHRVTFKWTADNGDVRTQNMDVMNGAKGDKGETGDAGLGIKAVNINAQNHLIITYDDDSTYDAGELPSGGEVISVNGKKGVVVLDASDVGALPDDTSIPSKTSDLTNDSIVDSASYDSTNHQILFKNGTTTLFSLDAAAFVKDGMVDTVAITGGNLVITFNTDAGKQAISIPITDIFDPANYYDKTATDNLFADKADKTSVIQFKATTETDANNLWEETGYYIVNTSDMTNLPTTDVSMGYCLGVIRYGSQSNSIVIQIAYRGNPTTESPMYIRRRFNSTWTDWVAIAKKSEVTVKADKTDVDSAIAGQQNLLKDTVGWTGKNLLPYPYKDGARTYNGVTYVYNSDNTITANGEATSASWRTLTENFSFLELGKKYRLSGCPTGGSSNSYLVQLTYNDGTEKYIQDYGDGIDFTYTGDFIRLQVIVKENYTANNLVFKPMIRRADITDDAYEPYHESVETMYEEDIHGMNLFDDSKIEVGKAWNGDTNANRARNIIPCGPNSEYIISMNGTNGLDSVFFSVSANIPPASQTVITSFPYTIRTGVSDRYITLGFNKTNIALSDVTALKIMLRKANIDDPTYRPYNPQAIQNQLNAQGVLGAKNLLQVKATSTTLSGVTFTVNEDGSVSTSGTSTASVWFNINGGIGGSQSFINSLKKGVPYIYSGTPSNAPSGAQMTMWDETDLCPRINAGQEQVFSISSDYVQGNRTNLSIGCSNAGISFDNLTFYPMVRLASDPDDTYQPYAMTNKELTEKIKTIVNETITEAFSAHATKWHDNANDCNVGFERTNNDRTSNMPTTIETGQTQLWYNIMTVRESNDSTSANWGYGFQIAVQTTTNSTMGDIYVRAVNGGATPTWSEWKKLN